MPEDAGLAGVSVLHQNAESKFAGAVALAATQGLKTHAQARLAMPCMLFPQVDRYRSWLQSLQATPAFNVQ